MYVNSSLTAQRIQKFVLVLGSFGLETALTREKNSVWEIRVQLEVSLDSKRCRSLFQLEVFQVRKLELYPGHGTICCNSVLLSVENSEEKTRRLRIGSSAEFLYSNDMSCWLQSSKSLLSNFTGYLIDRIGGGTFTG